MPKLKTHKATAKRMAVSKPKKKKGTASKLIIRRRGQDHFNANESGKKTRSKKKDTNMSKANTKNLKRLIPYA